MKLIGRWPAAGVSAVTLLAVSLLIGCATNNQTVTPPPTDAAIDVPQIIDGSVDGAQCTTTIELHADEGATHVPCTAPVDYQTEPPSSGNHYSCWAAYQTYTSPIPWGNLVHSLEHGAIVIVYNCPAGCDADVANIQAFTDGLPLDSDCAPTLGRNRIILMPDPDPNLGVRFAASSWDWTLRADCFDPVAFRRFFDDHYDHGREVICGNGWQPADLCSDVCQ